MKLTAKKLSKAEVDALVGAKLRWILSVCDPEEIIVFGSAANYEMTDASDVDLVVIFATAAELQKYKKELFRARPKDDWPQDLLLYTVDGFDASVRQGGGACWAARNEGRVLYRKEPK